MAAFLLMSFVAFLENQGYVACRTPPSISGLKQQEHDSQSQWTPSVPQSKPSPKQKRSPDQSALRDTPAGSAPTFHVDLSSVRLRKTSHLDRNREEAKQENVPDSSDSSSATPAADRGSTNELAKSIDFQRLSRREKLEPMKRASIRFAKPDSTEDESGPAMPVASRSPGARAVRPRRPKTSSVTAMLSRVETQAKEESLNEVKTTAIVEDSAPSPNAQSSAPERETPTDGETPVKNFKPPGGPHMLAMIQNLGPSMLRPVSGAGNLESKPPMPRAESSVDFRSVLRSRRQQQQQQDGGDASPDSSEQKERQLQKQSSAPVLPTRKPLPPSVPTATSFPLKRDAPREDLGGSRSGSPLRPPPSPPPRSGSIVKTPSPEENESKPMDFRSVLRKNTATRPQPPPRPSDDSECGVQQMDFRNVLRKRSQE